jgi:hypothetical protein
LGYESKLRVINFSFWLRKNARKPDANPSINVRITITGEKEDGFSLGYQVDPKKFDRKTGTVSGKSMEATEINNYILHVRC